MTRKASASASNVCPRLTSLKALKSKYARDTAGDRARWRQLVVRCYTLGARVTKAYDTSESFLSKVTFERKLSDVAYTLAQVFSCESQLSEIE